MALFNETAQWRVLSFFFAKPELEAYVREIACKAPVNEGSASIVCRKLEKEGILRSAKKGNSLFYSLNGANALAKRLKSTWFLEKLLPFSKDWENPEFQSVALYGSRSSGEFISKSDVDILVLSNAKEEAVRASFRNLKAGLEEEVSLTIFTVSQWRKMGGEGNPFYSEVLSNHVLLYGEPLVVG